MTNPGQDRLINIVLKEVTPEGPGRELAETLIKHGVIWGQEVLFRLCEYVPEQLLREAAWHAHAEVTKKHAGAVLAAEAEEFLKGLYE